PCPIPHKPPLRHFLLRLFCSPHLPPRHLHSFPTRRSSDLTSSTGSTTRRTPLPRSSRPGSCRRPRRLSGRRRSTSSRSSCSAQRDRKSTRLNSSHVSISYAVFCLKKKNNRLVSFHRNTRHI